MLGLNIPQRRPSRLSTRDTVVLLLEHAVALAIAFVLVSELWPPSNTITTITSSITTDITTTTTTTTTIDTSILIISGLTPQFPNDLSMIERTIRSLRYIQGIHPQSPIYISIDGLDPIADRMRGNADNVLQKKSNPNGDTLQNRKRLSQYITALHQRFQNYSQQVHVIPPPNNFTHLHIGGTIQQGLQHVQTKYVYLMQHDMPFRRPVNHTACTSGMQKYPNILKCIRFSNIRENALWDRSLVPLWECPDAPHHPVNIIVDQETHFFKNIWFSDNVQLTTKKFYMEEVIPIGMKGNLYQSPEVSLEEESRRNCTWGQYVYGTPPYDSLHERFTIHLDGRHSTSGINGKIGSTLLDWQIEDEPYPSRVDGIDIWID
mmetsp:Transcript_16992/g.32165  ORF Transcript_16992/g.32165 Transcript_16992/m.32165 type:complete len:376 (+) Transcript_16992:101-1228(+)